MELRQLRYFVTVSEERHFGRAAERLHIGQPAVSQQVRRLERELGVELFDRSPRHVRLTPAGETFLPAARAVLDAELRAAAAVAEFAGAHTGILRLGTSTGLGARLDRILDVLAQRAPHVSVELNSAPARDRLDRVAKGQLDASFVRGSGSGGALCWHPVWQEPLAVAVPAGHPLAAAGHVSLADLAALPLRLTSRRSNPALVDTVLTACRDAGFDPVPGPSSARTLEDTLAAIGTGAPTWTVVYAEHARQLRSTSRIAFLPLAGAGLAIPTSLVVRRSAPTPLLPLLLDACTERSRPLRTGVARDHES
ncbi:LysR family transcriptional regulator [Streptomyces physcomitrii]|uniref:LysR family transcriptional regulator n=1 Tax=Streptomyces physcomitrii TaxID=2724184 RepID=A0ABX1GWT0_9ACTN|nr:LysR family transcriptional regulator [Streptomyces physcomitrii]NKI40565.1 LysR family transcriptional regulator [Streptomyces physcomitrii]